MSQQTYYPQPAPAPQRGSSAGKIVGIVVAALVVLGGIAAGALFLFGKPMLDDAKVHDAIIKITKDASGLEPTNVVCPTKVAIKSGDVITCNGQLDGQNMTWTVRQTDDKGNVQIQSGNFLVVSKVEKALADRVGQQANTAVTAKCADGKTIVVGGKGTTMKCTATNASDPTDSAQFTATVTDDEGNVSFS